MTRPPSRAPRGAAHGTSRAPRRVGLAATLSAAALLAAACGGGSEAVETAAPDDWDAVLAEADGQTVDWYMYGGDERLNRFVNGEVADRLGDLGVTLRQVRISDTADAVNKVLGEQQAGRRSGGSVDAIWLNGENFATGVQAEAWRCGWAEDLPNAEFVDLDSPAVATDFGVPTEGCEAAWQQANSALVYDSAALDEDDVASLDALLAWAERNPGRFTYPAPPDFTGSMAVRTVLYDTLGGPEELAGDFDPAAYDEASARLWDRLREIAPTLWRRGETYPQSQEQVEKLFADGEISAFLTYGPGAVGSLVEDGVFPESTREAVLSVGNISNVSFVAVPANAGDQAGALVLANVLQDPEVQLGLYEAAGIYPAIDVRRTDPEVQERFAAVATSPSVLSPEELTRDARPELASEYLERIEDDWVDRVLQGRR
ncbi:ABC transporter substrate-binding protein [Nocardioides donggukensis]|uniref:ABC transporter substrate-binding protein n=1 Tax=Nocardioides donggukensis TaxID=2774019 RepID=A0A927K2G4_9ACTN|nr:ABC transporter substrate-binding protein [Nocardioides donggukensis]MBD8868248.1 ABC transporter substrate-binding protein [Nocardioides donggukensis]